MMQQKPLTPQQKDAAEKVFTWMSCSTAASVNGDTGNEEDGQPSGVALPPHERGCGHAHPMRGTNHEDLCEWCTRHES